jgi:hypothetical protein
VVLIGVGLALMTVSCGGGTSSTRSQQIVPPGSTNEPRPTGPTLTTAHVAQPAAATPSKSAEMICSAEAQQEILASATGVRTTAPVTASWNDHVYSCRYVYGTDAMVLSVKELADKTETDDYFASLKQQLGVSRSVSALGDGGFVTTNGSLVIRKDFKVLLVDVAKLPQQFGDPPDTRDNIAVNVGSVIMGCWTGE